MLQVITPRDERERQIVAKYENDVATRWDVTVGPLIRRKSDGKLIRMPDRTSVTRTDPQVATDAFVLGRGPGSAHGVIYCWIQTAQEFMTWSQADRAKALATALRNEEVYLTNLEASLRSKAEPCRSLLSQLSADQLGMVAPVAPTAPVRRTTAPHRRPSRVFEPAAA